MGCSIVEVSGVGLSGVEVHFSATVSVPTPGDGSFNLNMPLKKLLVKTLTAAKSS